MTKTAIFKFNGGNGAILCSVCQKIIKTLKEFSDEEKQALLGKTVLPEQFCKEHLNQTS
jgi:hypothetical protein